MLKMAAGTAKVIEQKSCGEFSLSFSAMHNMQILTGTELQIKKLKAYKTRLYTVRTPI